MSIFQEPLLEDGRRQADEEPRLLDSHSPCCHWALPASDSGLEVPEDEPCGAAALRTLCPARHDLQRFTVPWSGDFTCDRCQEDIAQGAVMWSCRCCNRDVCEACSCEGIYAWPRACSSGCQPLFERAANWNSHNQADAGATASRPWSRAAALQAEDLGGERAALPQAPPRGHRSCGAARPAGAVALPRQRDTGGNEKFALRLAEISQDWAVDTVSATTAEVSRLMAKVKEAPRDQKKVLITQATSLEASWEYVVALQHLQQEPPLRTTGVDPLGGVMVE